MGNCSKAMNFTEELNSSSECEHCENDLIRIRKMQNPAGDQEQKVIESCQQECRCGAMEGHKDVRRGWFSRSLGKTANFKETQQRPF